MGLDLARWLSLFNVIGDMQSLYAQVQQFPMGRDLARWPLLIIGSGDMQNLNTQLARRLLLVNVTGDAWDWWCTSLS